MTLEMRELKGDDLFTLLAIVGKLDIKDDFVALFQGNVEESKVVPMDKQKKAPTKAEQAKAEEEAQLRGMKAMAGMMQKVLLNAKSLKTDINDLLAGLTGETTQVIGGLSLKEYTGLIVEFFKKPELADFFSSIASLL